MTPDALAQALTEAEGGSLFLSEVTDLPADAQFALLEALETGTRTRVLAGSTAPLSPNAAGMNADLFYRLEALRLRIPALRDRPEDIPVLFRHYVAQACEQAGIPERAVGGQTVADLMAQDWPGNARSLMNAAMRFALGVDEPAAGKIQAGLSERMAQIEASLLIDALRDNGGNASNTAAQLKLPRKTFYDKLARHGIRAEDYR
jgi:two-component system C4-dicarboxylate transport response regulator DctD